MCTTYIFCNAISFEIKLYLKKYIFILTFVDGTRFNGEHSSVERLTLTDVELEEASVFPFLVLYIVMNPPTLTQTAHKQYNILFEPHRFRTPLFVPLWLKIIWIHTLPVARISIFMS